MIRVDIEGKNSIEFPDDTPQDVIERVVKEQVGQQEPSEPSLLRKMFPTVGKAWDIQQEEANKGMRAMGQAIEEPSLGNIVSGVGGAVGWAISPITGVARGMTKPAVEAVPRAIGVPEGATQFLGRMGEEATYIAPYGKVVQAFSKLEKGAELTGVATKGKGLIKEKPPLEFPAQPTTEVAAKLSAEGELTKPFIQEDLQKEIAEQSVTAIKEAFSDKKRIGQQIVDLVHSGDIEWKGLTDVVKKYEITPQELAIQLKETYSAAGRTLGRLSQTVKKLEKQLPEAAEFLKGLEKELPEATRWDKFMNLMFGLESKRRGLLVTQLATSVRNIASQSMRMTIGSFDDALQGAINATVGGKGDIVGEIGKGLDTFGAFMSRITPSKRKLVDNILNAEGNELHKLKLFSAPVAETIGGKFVNLLNTVNRGQEYFFRRIGFEAKLTQELKALGQDIKNINPSEIPRDVYEKAIQYAHDITFSSMPKTKWGQKFVQDWSNNPLMTALVNPFPRFAFGNALPFIKNFSPISLIEALNPKVVAELASGHPERFAKLASQGTIGTLMLHSAVAYRNSPNRGEKYWEINIGDKTVDTRNYAPIIAPYLLMAEIISHPENVKPMDIASNLIGLNRVAGTAFVLTDALRGKKVEDAAETLGQLAGAYIGSFTVPFKTIKDMYSVVDENEALIRDTRENPMISPAIANVPIISKELPAARSPMRGEPLQTEKPLFKQLTGLTIKTKNLIEKEVDRLDFDRSRLYPRTGMPEADREIMKRSAPYLEKFAPVLFKSPIYQKASDPIKRLLIAEMSSKIKQAAKAQLIQENPELGLMLRYEGLQEDMKKALEEKGYKAPGK